MLFSKSGKPQSRIDTLIGAGTTIEGNVSFAGGLRVDGVIRGNVSAAEGEAGTLVVSEHARIEGKVCVPHLVINGTVAGPLVAGESLELQARARVTGDVEYSSVEIQLGAVVDGRLVHRPSGGKAVELKLASSS